MLLLLDQWTQSNSGKSARRIPSSFIWILKQRMSELYRPRLFADKSEALDCVGLFPRKVSRRVYSSSRVKAGVAI